MITARLLTVLAASSLAAVAYAQTQPAPSTQPKAAPGYNTSQPHKRELKSVGSNEAMPANSRAAPGSGLTTSQVGTETTSSRKSAPGAALSTSASSQRDRAESLRMAEAGPGVAGQSWSRVSVQSPSGRSLGSVSRVVPGLNGRVSSGYVLVSGANGTSVPVPYPTAHSMVRNGKLVLSQSQFDQAPKVTRQDLKNTSDHAWRIKADHYWMQKGHAPAQR